MDGVSWSRYEGRALADPRLAGDALFAELADFVRSQNSQLTDIRLERAYAAAEYDTSVEPARRWYDVVYLADETA